MSAAAPPVSLQAPHEGARARRKPWWFNGWTLLLLLLVLVIALAPIETPYGPVAQLPAGLSPLGSPLPPGPAHWLGTDELGRDVLSRVLYGGRASLVVSLAATLMAGMLGVGLGLVSGFAGGRVDNLLMRLTEVAMAFPALLLAIALASVLPSGPFSVVLTLGLVGWPNLARIIRGSVLALREKEYIAAATAQGAGPAWVLARHIWPNVRALVITLLALKVADMLLLEASLGFLGLGVAPPQPSWGSLVGEGRNFFHEAPWVGLPAGFAIFLTVLVLNFLAEAYEKRPAA